MKKIIILMAIAVNLQTSFAEVVCSGASSPCSIGRCLPYQVVSTTNMCLRLSYDSLWNSNDADAKTVISCNAIRIAELGGRGDYLWSPNDYGMYVLSCVTEKGGTVVGTPYSMVCDVVDCREVGIPGLQRVTFTGSAFDASPVAFGYEPIVTLTGEGMYDDTIPTSTTYAYTGYMYFRGGENYTFRGYFDDYSSVRVDDQIVVAKNSTECKDETGKIKFDESGWHKVEFRVSNNGGTGGPKDDVGIQYQTDVNPMWHKIEDDGSGTIFRTGPDYCGVRILSARMRPSDPTIMDVVYKVQSPKEKVSVRALAYENGNRSFANAVPVLTFADGTGVNIGDDITANEEHTLSWQVAADWATDLTKVRFEVMVMDEGLLPLHFVTIPKTANHAAIQYSDTVLSSTAVMNALFWLYAGLDDDLSLSNGRLSGPFGELANGANVSNPTQTVSWLYQKMGYSTLTGANLNYVNSAARINLTPSGLRQFAVKTIK